MHEAKDNFQEARLEIEKRADTFTESLLDSFVVQVDVKYEVKIPETSP